MTTTYDLKKQKDKLFKFYIVNDGQKLMKNIKMLRKTKTKDLCCVFKEWIHQYGSEYMLLDGMLIMKQAKIYYSELKSEGNYGYSTG
ncbi:hypothetical protein AAY473_006899 [Plecturocebus cupreus]